VVQWLRELFVSNVRHVSQIAFRTRMLGRARDAYGGRAQAPHDEEPGVLGELRPVVERAIAAHEALLDWHSERERVELDAKTGKPTGRKGIQVFRVPTSYRAAVDEHLKRVLFTLRAELGRGKGRAPTLVWPVRYAQAVAVRERRQTADARLQYLHKRAPQSADAAVRAKTQREVEQLMRKLEKFRPARPRELVRALRERLLRAGAGKATAKAVADEVIDRLHSRVTKVRTNIHSIR
jgi:hypothetical protein